MGNRRVLLAVLFAVILGIGQRAQAAPVLGDLLFYTGGDVTVKALPVNSGFTSQLGLYDPAFNLKIALTFDEPPFPAQPAITFNPGALGFAVGDELMFGINVLNNGNKFFMGPAARNADNVIHAGVDNIGGGIYVVGFEDLFGGGDRDYDDNRFQFEGAVSTAAVPEPATLSLLALGMLPAARRRARQYFSAQK